VSSVTSLRGLDHVGLTVPHLDQAVRFFNEAFDAELLFQHGPYRGRGDVQERQFARHRDTEVVGIAMLRLGSMNLELLEFTAPDQRREPPRTSDLGGHHLALYVDDLEGAIVELAAHGARVLGKPMALPGPESGPDAWFVFCLTPWGLALELVSYASGKAYEASTARRLFDPRALPLVTSNGHGL